VVRKITYKVTVVFKNLDTQTFMSLIAKIKELDIFEFDDDTLLIETDQK